MGKKKVGCSDIQLFFLPIISHVSASANICWYVNGEGKKVRQGRVVVGSHPGFLLLGQGFFVIKKNCN